MAVSGITLEDVLGVKYLGKWDWSPDGKRIAYIWDDGGLQDLWMVEPGVAEARKITSASRGVSDLAWSPVGDLYFVQDGSLYRAGDGDRPELLLESKSPVSGLSWSPDGSLLAFARDSKVWLYRASSGQFSELDLPGKSAPAGEHAGVALWTPCSCNFAFAFRDEETYRQIGIAHRDGCVTWRSYFKGSAGPMAWLDNRTLYYAQPRDDGASADLMALDAPPHRAAGAQRAEQIHLLQHVEGTGKGPIFDTSALPSPDGTKALLLLENDGYAHHYLMTRTAGGAALEQVTFGRCEDFGHAGDSAQWAAGSRSFLYSSNRDDASQRHIFRHDLETGADAKVIGLQGTNTMAKVSSTGRIAFQHCDEFRNMDIWVAGPNGEDPRQVTFSMPPGWTREAQAAPEEVTFESNGGFTIHGYLVRPKDIPAGARLPAMVWVHGGPVRQMRPGWNPLRSYALFNGFNQYLVQRGYVVLSVNYRGGIGYGRDFRQALYHKMGVDDVADVVGAGRYLKSLPYVDPGKVGVWGLSYGGYMTLHSLTQYPEEFRCGVNIAGIWDFPQWTKWADRRYGKGGGFFKAYFGGEPETSVELYRQGSPKTFAGNMVRPLLNVQGMKDMNVDFQQMDRIIEDLTELGKDFEVIYYPDEVHTFAKKRTWMDAMPKILRFLDRNLK